MIYRVHWKDREGEERQVFSDRREDVEAVRTALLGDSRHFSVAPSIESQTEED